jgi:hypothetical protein
MLVHPRPMCPRPKILGCCIPWTKCPLAILPLTEPSHPFDLILCVCRACIRLRGANPINLVRGVGEAGQTPHWSIRRRRPTERGPGSGYISQGHNIQGTLCSRGATSKNFRSGTHRSGTHQPCISIYRRQQNHSKSRVLCMIFLAKNHRTLPKPSAHTKKVHNVLQSLWLIHTIIAHCYNFSPHFF